MRPNGVVRSAFPLVSDRQGMPPVCSAEPEWGTLMLFLTDEQIMLSERFQTQYGYPQFIADGLAKMPFCYQCDPPRKLRAGRRRWYCRNHPHDIHPECR